MDVSHFRQEELNLILKDEERLVVHGTHMERPDTQQDPGTISREFFRQYILPKDCDRNGITAQFSNDGVLLIKVRKRPHKPQPAREVRIALVEPAANRPC
nr:hypothetical protein BaRGS_025559 [Batillaria attramentaria]